MCRLATCWAEHGPWDVPPGDVARLPFISTDRDEAKDRLRTIEQILDVIGIPYKPRAGEVEVEERENGRPYIFKVLTCSISGTVGKTTIFVCADEMARWESGDAYANPAREVMASLRPSMATQPRAIEVDLSSPWSTTDYHAELFDQGDTPGQITSYAPTWEANPTITEEFTRELEPDERIWAREYKAIPGGTVTDGWFGAALSNMQFTGPLQAWSPGERPIIFLDPAFAQDRFAWAVVVSRPSGLDERGRVLRVTDVLEVGQWIPDRSPLEMAKRFKREVAFKYDTSETGALQHIYSDQFEGFSFTELAKSAGLAIEVVPWTGGSGEESKATKYRNVRMAGLAGTIRLHNTDHILEELGQVRGILMPSGHERIEIPRTKRGHGDRTAALVGAIAKALELHPSGARPPEVVLTEMQRHRKEMAEKIQKKHEKSWKKHTIRNMRRIVLA